MESRKVSAIIYYFFINFLLVISLNAAIPNGYYDGTEGLTGSALRAKLKDIIDDHTALSYDNARRAMFGTIDNVNGKVQCVYTGNWYNVAPNTIPDANQFNCEHSWCQSWFEGTSEATAKKSDLHHLFPTFANVNSLRGNWPLYTVTNITSTWGSGNWTSKYGKNQVNQTCFEPGIEHKGDVARAFFYFMTRYNVDITTTMTQQGYNTPDIINMLIQWHTQDPVSQKEINRNDLIYSNYQHNRNPFIDHPEFVYLIWGNGGITDTTPPVISNILANPQTNSATITWTTNENSNSIVYYGLSSSNLTNTLSDNNMVTNHSITINGLNANTTYYYKVSSKDASNNTSTSDVKSFTTTNVVTPTENGIIITEVAANPNGSYTNEYIELYNASNQAIDITNWQLIVYRNGSTNITVTFGTTGTSYGTRIIQPNNFYIITRGTVNYINRIEYSSFYLNKDFYVELKKPDNTLADRAGNSSGFFGNATNYELANINSDNSLLSSWIDKGSAYAGTPGVLYSTQSSINNPPVLQTIGNKTVNENSELIFTISATDSDGDILTYSVINLPNGALFNSTTKTFSWTPTYEQAGTYQVTFNVTDNKGGNDSETVIITVNDVQPINQWIEASKLISSPHNYTSNYDYTWTITETNASKIKVYFDKFETEAGYDYVYIYDGNGTLITKYDGVKAAFWSTEVAGNTIKIRLKTDGSVNKYGFDIKKIAYYNGSSNNTSNWITENYSLSSPNPYGNNYDNTWTITKSGAQKIKVHFSSFSVETNYDFVYIYNSENVEIAKLTGDKAAFWSVEIPGNTVKIRLVTDNSVTKAGFVIDQISYLLTKSNSFSTLNQNYPNPFNPSTTISYNIADNCFVSLNIYNIEGKLVKTLVNEYKNSGTYYVKWDGLDNNNQKVSSGIYFYTLNAGEFKETKKMVLMK